MSRNYRKIKGILYDRSLLKKAFHLTKSQGDGRISLADAKNLWAENQEATDSTKVERRTIQYILQHYRLTKPAKTYIHQQFYLTYNDVELLQMTRDFAYEQWGIHGTNFHEPIADRMLKQEKLANNQVHYPKVISSMLDALFEDSNRIDTPYQIVSQIYELEDSPTVQKILNIHLSNSIFQLLPIFDTIKEDEKLAPFPLPKNGETTKENWIFHLQLPTLSNHQWWMIVPRNGEVAYTYGFEMISK